jgi:hypothetical protein
MIFLPEDLPFVHGRLPQDAVLGMEYFSRDALEAAVPPADRAAYLREWTTVVFPLMIDRA